MPLAHRLAAAALLLLPAAAHAQAARPAPTVPPLPASTAEVRFDSTGLAYTRLVNRTFRHVTLDAAAPDGAPRELLLLEEVDAAVRNDREGVEASVRVRAFAPQGRRFTRLAWTVAAPGHALAADFGRFLRVTLPGCCAALPTHGWYALDTGGAVTSFTAEPVLVPADAPEDAVFAVFHSAMAATPPPELRDAGEVAGVLRLVVNGRVADVVTVASTAEVGGDGILALELPAGDGAAASSRVSLRFGGGETLRLRVRGGRFDLQGADLPQGFAVERRPVR